MLSAEQLRMARACLDWTQQELSDRTGIPVPTIKRIEKQGTGRMAAERAVSLKATFEDAGIRFIENGCLYQREQETGG